MSAPAGATFKSLADAWSASMARSCAASNVPALVGARVGQDGSLQGIRHLAILGPYQMEIRSQGPELLGRDCLAKRAIRANAFLDQADHHHPKFTLPIRERHSPGLGANFVQAGGQQRVVPT